MRARDAVLGVGDDEGGQRHAADIERQHFGRIDPGRQQLDDAGEPQRDQRGHGKGQPAAAGEKAAQQRMLAAGAIFRNDLLRRGRDAEVHHAAEQQHPGPDIDIDAVVGAAHPARQQDLREIGQCRADDADDEDGAGEPPRQRGLAGAAEQHRPQPRDQRRRAGRCGFCIHHGHGKVLESARRLRRGLVYQPFVKIRLGERRLAQRSSAVVRLRVRDDAGLTIQIRVELVGRLGPTSVNFSAAPSGLAPGGSPSRSNAKRFTPGGLGSTGSGTGSAQSGVGPSTNRLTSLPSGETTSTST